MVIITDPKILSSPISLLLKFSKTSSGFFLNIGHLFIAVFIFIRFIITQKPHFSVFEFYIIACYNIYRGYWYWSVIHNGKNDFLHFFVNNFHLSLSFPFKNESNWYRIAVFAAYSRSPCPLSQQKLYKFKTDMEAYT